MCLVVHQRLIRFNSANDKHVPPKKQAIPYEREIKAMLEAECSFFMLSAFYGITSAASYRILDDWTTVGCHYTKQKPGTRHTLQASRHCELVHYDQHALQHSKHQFGELASHNSLLLITCHA